MTLRALVAQMNRNVRVERKRGGNGKACGDAPFPCCKVGNHDVGTVARARHDGRRLARRAACEDGKRKIGKAKAGPEHACPGDPALARAGPRRRARALDSKSAPGGRRPDEGDASSSGWPPTGRASPAA